MNEMNTITKTMCPLVVLMLAGLSAGGTLPPIERNACDGINAKPLLYTPYYSTDCPPVNTVYSNGQCAGWKNTDVECTSFCQNDTTFSYGQESPFARSDCHYPLECSISESSSTSYSYGVSISPKVGKALKIGVSGSFSYGTSTAYGRSWSFTPQPGDCGYFTWVPIQKTVCGTLTLGSVITLDPTDPNPIYICDPNPATTSSSCYSEAWTVSKAPDGVVAFVYTDCATRAPLGPERQDPAYNQPGVALPPSIVVNIQDSWANSTCIIVSRMWPPAGDGGDLIDFKMQGAGMDWASIGDAGEGLLSQLTGSCGNGTMLNGTQATPWNFTWTPEDPVFDFTAEGTMFGLDHGNDSVPNCIGDVLVSLGGPFRDGCQGWD